MKEEMETISAADLKACEEDMKAFFQLAVSLVNHCLQVDPEFKNDWLYGKAMEVLRVRDETLLR